VRSIGRAAVAVACGVVLLAGGCAKHGARNAAPGEIPGVAPAPGGLKFSVSIRPQRLALGQRLYMEASMFNDSEHVFKKDFSTGCAWDYEVLDENGAVVGPVHTCADSAQAKIQLEPGELRMIVREWKGHDKYFSGPADVGPGRYQIVAGFVGKDLRVVAMSAPVWVEITPRVR
jgi:hypothetical protein